MKYFITGIGTNVGKTIVSAILTEALQADYWKPIQSGTIDGKDADVTQSYISNSITIIHPETYSLKAPLSPHFAAELENIMIDMNHINLPVTSNKLIIEGAGGLLVPINDVYCVIDVAKKCQSDIILVISNYLGCINHSLLSINYLLQHQYPIKAVVFNGTFEKQVKQAILNHVPQWVAIIDIPTLSVLSKESIKECAAGIDLSIF